jgi:hypothetical protein
MYLNLRIHGSILTKDKNFTSEKDGKGSEIAVSGSLKAQTVI